MNIKIVSKDLIATEAIKDYIGKKSVRYTKRGFSKGKKNYFIVKAV